MKKIPTIFERDWNGDKSLVLDVINPKCQWVFDGEGIATRKIDGTCCMARAGKLFKRRELRRGQIIPHDFEISDTDDETGKIVGWMPVGNHAEDRWHVEAFQSQPGLPDGTYELIGPRIQGDPENAGAHILVRHGVDGMAGVIFGVPRSFDGIRDVLAALDIEGLVFHHPDGRMAKIKKRDFGLKRAADKAKTAAAAEQGETK